MFNRILIANRGEIAVRIIRACQEMGIQTVAVYSKADRESRHVKLANSSVCIGDNPSSESYLNIPAIISAAEIATIQMYLDITAADIHAARAATGACDCTLQSWAMDFFAKINIIEAGAFYTCSCGAPRLTDEVKASMLTWANEQLEAVRNGKLAPCTGDTALDYPAVGWAEIGHTVWNEADIIENYNSRTP